MTHLLILVVVSLIKTLALIFVIILPMVSYTVYAERRVSAMIQDRLGPNRVGIPLTLFGFSKDIPFFGLAQPIADALKLMLKEDFTPAHVNKFYYWLAPACAMAPSMMALAVIPFGSQLWGEPMVVANVNIGVLWVFAVSSLGVYGIVLAGWSSNSKYPFLGGLRFTNQKISYELSLALSVIPIFMICRTLNLSEIVKYQTVNGWLISPIWIKGISLFPLSVNFQEIVQSFDILKILLWIPLFISFIVFTISMFAETNRLPFDLPEAETELVGGYHTEYSSMKFALFFLAEYSNMVATTGMMTTLFFGGWTLPFWGLDQPAHNIGIAIVQILIFLTKMAALMTVFIWVRWMFPRFRYDQLMDLGWRRFVPLALANILVTAVILWMRS